MIILDTNVISEPMRSAPDPAVVAWLDAQAIETLHLTSITLAELRYGIATLSPGRRRATLQRRIEDEVIALFAGRILAFDEAASVEYGRLRAETRASGVAVGDLDAMIAAIALSHDLAVATRDAKPFAAAGVRVINPYL